MNGEEREQATALWQKLGKLEAARPTADQLLAFMRQCGDAAGLELASRMLDAADQAHQCFIADHSRLLEELTWTRRELAEAHRVVDAVDAWLKDDS